MLNQLSKKLHVLFVCGMMAIITLVIGVVGFNNAKTKQAGESDFFQRMSMLLTYQLEDDTQNIKDSIESYEEKNDILCLLTDKDNTVLYKGKRSFQTDTDTLLEQFYEQISTQQETMVSGQTYTMQDGLFEVNGDSDDRYWGIPATIVTKKGQTYQLLTLYEQESTFEILKTQLPLYGLLWLVSFAGVAVAAHFLLKKALKPTERVLTGQKNFVASASHELKAPLAVLVANADRIESQNSRNPVIEQAVNVIGEECMRMSGLIQDMLLLSSTDAGTWKLQFTRVNVDTLLITLYEMYESFCIQNGMALEMDIIGQSYPVIVTDKERVLQILGIFIDNAVQHSGSNSGILIQTEQTSKIITFLVRDYGKGIKPEEQQYIFDRFYCLDKSHGDKSHFGLGLSIAKELSGMLGGAVGYKDTPHGGATFYLSLKL